MNWNQVPYSCSIENYPGLFLVYADSEKVSCIRPLDYMKLQRKIKQNANNPINKLYSTS